MTPGLAVDLRDRARRPWPRPGSSQPLRDVDRARAAGDRRARVGRTREELGSRRSPSAATRSGGWRRWVRRSSASPGPVSAAPTLAAGVVLRRSRVPRPGRVAVGTARPTCWRRRWSTSTGSTWPMATPGHDDGGGGEQADAGASSTAGAEVDDRRDGSLGDALGGPLVERGTRGSSSRRATTSGGVGPSWRASASRRRTASCSGVRSESVIGSPPRVRWSAADAGDGHRASGRGWSAGPHSGLDGSVRGRVPVRRVTGRLVQVGEQGGQLGATARAARLHRPLGAVRASAATSATG